LYKLAILLAVPTPQDIPLTRNSRIRVPGTGPYKIAKYDGKSQLVLDRNPYFHQWSYAAQPDGLPDQITWKSDKSADAVIADVLAGRADIANPRDVSPSLIADLARNHLGQIHVQPTFGFEWVSLNVHTPPFDHAGVRQAFNYAVDRRVIASFYGGSLYATPTCQLLMPSFPAYRPYCPYATTQFEPNLSKARALVAASGTRGAEVTVWAPNFRFYPEEARYLASVLRSLGYRAFVHIVDRGGDTVRWLSDPNNRLQATALIGWQADYPLPSTFFDDLVACKSRQVFGTTSSNRGGYCNQRLDSLIAAAEAADPTDPVTAREIWREADRLAVEDAAIVPTVVQQDSVITSARVRNVQNTPLDLPILDQIWVR
jgi:peptide/nickel transport system substrate-binding protein